MRATGELIMSEDFSPPPASLWPPEEPRDLDHGNGMFGMLAGATSGAIAGFIAAGALSITLAVTLGVVAGLVIGWRAANWAQDK